MFKVTLTLTSEILTQELIGIIYYTFTWDYRIVENWLIDATSLLVSYVGDTDVVKHLF